MKVVLLNPVARDGLRSLRVGRCQGKVMVGMWPNIEYGYLASLLERDGFEVVLLDANQEALDYTTMLRRVVSQRPDIVFILSITATLIEDLFTGRDLRLELPSVRIVFWGTHATVRPDDYLVDDGTMLIRREPELSGLELCRALRRGATQFPDVLGVSWRTLGESFHSPDRPFLDDLDSLPFPSQKAMRIGEYVATDIHRPFALVKTSRGCPHQCQFCTVHSFHGDRWRARSPQSILDEIQQIQKETGVRDFFLQSDVFSKNKAWTTELCEGFLHRNIHVEWFCNSRVDSHDEETLALMKRAGCRLVAFGVESGSDAVLRTCGKGTTANRARETLAACRKVGLPTLTYWVFGLPGETSQTLQETLDFVRETRPDYAHFYAPTPLPGSRLFHLYGVEKAVEDGDMAWAEFFQGVSRRFVAPSVSVEEVRQTLNRAYFLFYSDPRRVLRELKLSLGDWRQAQGRLTTFATMLRNYVVTR